MLYTVRDTAQNYRFDGELIAESSSRGYNKPRWVEFKLYKTAKGPYVVSRVGATVTFHSDSCELVKRNSRMKAVMDDEIPAHYIPCDLCKPARISVNGEGLYPEIPRYWAQICKNASGVIESLMSEDANENRYMTLVAKRLLEYASLIDDDIQEAFETYTI